MVGLVFCTYKTSVIDVICQPFNFLMLSILDLAFSQAEVTSFLFF